MAHSLVTYIFSHLWVCIWSVLRLEYIHLFSHMISSLKEVAFWYRGSQEKTNPTQDDDGGDDSGGGDADRG